MKLNFFSKAILAKIFLYSGFFLPLLANAQNLANAQKSVDEMCLCNRGPSKKIEGRDFEVAVMTYKRGNIEVLMNMSDKEVDISHLPGEQLISSQKIDGKLPPKSSIWLLS